MSSLLHQLFEQQVLLRPESPAIKFESHQFNYIELERKSNQLANCLIAKGIRNGDVVKICLERSPEMIIGILGILKCGAAYLPIDPESPGERIRFLYNETPCNIIVTSNRTVNQLNEIVENQIAIVVDDCCTTDSKFSIDHPNRIIDDRLIAVILYTSGSTGVPKGVMLSHRSLVNRLIWDREYYHHSSSDIILQHATFTFDFSLLEIFMALANGGKLVLARPHFHYESSYLIGLIQAEKITKMGSVPSLMKSYLHFEEFRHCTSLRQIFLGGEVLDTQLQNNFYGKSSAELINIYGPTETSISVLHWHCQRDSDQIVPIGYPIASAKVYLLDDDMNPVDEGEVGEIYIAGDCVAKGYYNQPELTNERFVYDPYYTDNQHKMYKTGDFGKKLANGAYQFIGRKDDQIKIRGLRVELSEIERCLKSHKWIADSVVKGIKNPEGEMKIIAFIVPSQKEKFELNTIKQHLSSQLPSYMVPGMFVEMKKLPLLANGKVDRNVLLYPEISDLISDTTFTASVNETQQRLIGIWEKVLKLHPIGINDSFCNLGGDSLALVQIHYLIEVELHCHLPLSCLAKNTTIREQAYLIDHNVCSSLKSSSVLLGEKFDKKPLIIVQPIFDADYNVAKNLSTHLENEYSIIATLPIVNDSSLSIKECALQYIESIEQQFPSNEYVMGGFSMGGLVTLEMAALWKEKGKKIDTIYLFDTYHPAILHDIFMISPKAKRLIFYFKKVIISKPKIKKEILLHLYSKVHCRIVRWLQHRNWITSGDSLIHLNLINQQKQSSIMHRYIEISLNYRIEKSDDRIVLITKSNDESSFYYGDSPQYTNRNIVSFKAGLSENISVHKIPASHSTLVEEPNCATIAQIILNNLTTIQ